MAKAIEQKDDKLMGHFGFADRNGAIDGPHEAAHDGDTFTVRALGNFGLRFLGIDTPEVSFRLPEKKDFTPIQESAWEAFLTAPFSPEYGPLSLDAALMEHLAGKIGAGCATNHAKWGTQAQAALEQELRNDLQGQGATNENFRLFLRFASDALDVYGRLLAYVNCDERDPAERKPTYNERMLAAGMALPYFIWPNVNPFRKQVSLPAAVLRPGTAAEVGNGDLREPRRLVAEARKAGKGLFAADGLRLDPSELRYLAQRTPPGRWVIDLSSTGNLLHHPQRYFEIPNHEDRLYVSEQHADMFVAVGWVKQGI
jgi:endonuclease YncB( thermonuclease family)